jgi:MFS transporter, AAHS family, 4-hydroxybenzoate transporter
MTAQQEISSHDSAAKSAVDIAALIDSLPMSRLQIMVLLLCSLAGMLGIFALATVNYVAPAGNREWNLAPTELGTIFSAGVFGMLVGCAVIGIIADCFGRRAALVLSMAFASMSLLTAFTSSFWGLFICRFLTGVGAGAVIPILTTTSSEFSPQRLRTILVNLTQLGLPVGLAAAGFVTAAMVRSWGWRSVFMVSGLAPLLLIIPIVMMVPESLHFLARKTNSGPKIAGILNRLNPSGGYSADSNFILKEVRMTGVPVKHLFGRTLIHNTFLLWSSFFLTLLSIYLFDTWLPSILVKGGINVAQAAAASALYGVAGAVAAAPAGWFMGRFGSRRVLTIGFLFDGLICIGFSFLQSPSPGLLYFLICATGFLTIGGQTGLNTMTAAVYPSDVRGTGVGWALGIGRIGAVVGPIIGGSMTGLGSNLESFLLVVGLIELGGALAISLVRHSDYQPDFSTEHTEPAIQMPVSGQPAP